MHPLAIAAIFGGGVLGTFLLYEIATNIYEEYQERRQYEEYLRNQYPYSRYRQSYRQRMNNDFEFEDDRSDSEDEKQDTFETCRVPDNDQFELRQRRRYSQSSLDNEKLGQDQYELSELEDSINERRRRLMAEQAFLDKEEEMLQSRRDALNKSATESSLDSSFTQRPLGDSFNPFMDGQEESSSFADDFENKMSLTEQEHKQDPVHEEERQIVNDSLYHSLVSYNEPNDLQFPSPSITERASVATASIPSTKGDSDSEGSWDAVSEDDWLKSVDNSDEERQFSD